MFLVFRRLVVALILGIYALFPVQAAESPALNFSLMTEQFVELKKEMLDLNRDLNTLEEQMLFPGKTQLSIFFSADWSKQPSKEKKITLKIDGETLLDHLYTRRELESFQKGGIHHLYTGYLTEGKHTLLAFIGKYRAALSFQKEPGSTKTLEIKLTNNDAGIKEWQ